MPGSVVPPENESFELPLQALIRVPLSQSGHQVGKDAATKRVWQKRIEAGEAMRVIRGVAAEELVAAVASEHDLDVRRGEARDEEGGQVRRVCQRFVEPPKGRVDDFEYVRFAQPFFDVMGSDS